MRKCVWTLNIDNYAPELTALTYPLMRRYADKIGADFRIITQRHWPNFPPVYEKLQLHWLGREFSWNFYVDSDALIYPDFFDPTEWVGKDTVLHNGCDLAATRWRMDNYFRRDGRRLGSCNWFTVASDWCLDLWRPLDDLTFEEAAANIYPNIHELTTGIITREHLIDDYVLSRNIARFGLKFATINDMCKQIGWNNGFLHHVYKETLPRKVELAKIALKAWKLDTLFPEYEFLRQFEVRGEENAPVLISK